MGPGIQFLCVSPERLSLDGSFVRSFVRSLGRKEKTCNCMDEKENETERERREIKNTCNCMEKQKERRKVDFQGFFLEKSRKHDLIHYSRRNSLSQGGNNCDIKTTSERKSHAAERGTIKTLYTLCQNVCPATYIGTGSKGCRKG